MQANGWCEFGYFRSIYGSKNRVCRGRRGDSQKNVNQFNKTKVIDELYDLVNDPDEYQNLVADPEYAEVAKQLRDRIDVYFEKYADQKYDLWNGGTAKSNSDRSWLWKDVWGKDWESSF